MRIPLASLLLALCLALPAAALDIGFTATDLPDGAEGDLWRLTYTLDAFAYPAGHGFSVGFDPAQYGTLSNPVAGPDWDAIVLQPDPLLPDFGLYDVLALTGDPSVGEPFQVDVIVLGGGRPGSQPFVVFDDQFATVLEGRTVPEPGLLGLLAFSALTLRAHRRPVAR